MNIIIWLSVGVVLGYFGFRVLGDKNERGEVVEKITPRSTFKKVKSGQVEEKREDIEEKIMSFLERQMKISNDNVQELLGVADSTATKYLQRLENEGKIKQIGTTGQGVYYIKI